MRLNEATVLVVDDERELADIVAGWLEKEGSRALSADSGARALELLRHEKVHAIVTDIRMPEMDGTELVRTAKASGQYTPVTVSISGFSDLSAREAYDLGIEEQLAKPVARKALISAVRRSLADREELWGEPFRLTTGPLVRLQFESLEGAIRKRQLFFGRGGFCLSSELVFPEASSMGFELLFGEEKKLVSLQGVIRWSAPNEHLCGVEIISVGIEGRSWLARLACVNQALSFIPRSPNRSDGVRPR